MIYGIGNDIIEINRVQGVIDRHGKHFLDKTFTPREQQHCRTYQNAAPHFAGRFAAKEAIAKALGTGFGQDLAFLDLEIINDTRGKPVVVMSEGSKEKFGKFEIMVSISHSKEYATAVAIVVTPPA